MKFVLPKNTASASESFLETSKLIFTKQEYSTWILTLHFLDTEEGLDIFAPNQYTIDWLKQYKNVLFQKMNLPQGHSLNFKLGSRLPPLRAQTNKLPNPPALQSQYKINSKFSFSDFIEGKSNRLAKAAALQACNNPGSDYNPLFIYGGVGLGKTHLMQAIGNQINKSNNQIKIAYLNSERFVSDMVKGLQHNKINEFKSFFRTLDVLLIDDIQFFANKERSQEEFFHTFNALIEDQKQMVFSCDKYPKDVKGLEERLKSRFGWGLTVALEPPDMETAAAILIAKGQRLGTNINNEVALLIADRVKSNIRELEGALKRLITYSKVTSEKITVELTKVALKDLFAAHDRSISISLIQHAIAEYYKIRVIDLSNKTRSRSIARPRQMAMFLSRELTKLSLPEIGQAFGGRDHSTVIHACKKIKELKASDSRFEEDYNNLYRTLTN
jgi:chromosomal replication initiator protein